MKTSVFIKKSVIAILALICTSSVRAENISGSWYGAINGGNHSLRIVIHIKQSESGFSSTMDSPDQSAKGIPVKKTEFSGQTLLLEIPQLSFSYKGNLVDTDSIEGKMVQHGHSFGLNLKRKNPVEQEVNRPQTPKEPYPYLSENIHFQNEEEGCSLAGTITIPQNKKKSPAVVLVSGSGLQNRDNGMFEHKSFLVISDYLTRNGIAVLRYDDRGFGESKGNPKDATTLDFATDAEAAVNYLKTRTEIDPAKIGIIGHSEGGIISFILAAKENSGLAFIVSMAGSGIKGDSILLMQREAIFRAANMSGQKIQEDKVRMRKVFELINQYTGSNELTEKLISSELLNTSEEKAFTQPWMKFFLRYDPSSDLQQITCPALAINGEKDLQVPAKENLEAIKRNIGQGGNPNITIKSYPDLNHLFQTCETGAVEEYGKIEETISPQVLEDITGWILGIMGRR